MLLPCTHQSLSLARPIVASTIMGMWGAFAISLLPCTPSATPATALPRAKEIGSGTPWPHGHPVSHNGGGGGGSTVDAVSGVGNAIFRGRSKAGSGAGRKAGGSTAELLNNEGLRLALEGFEDLLGVVPARPGVDHVTHRERARLRSLAPHPETCKPTRPVNNCDEEGSTLSGATHAPLPASHVHDSLS